MVHFYKIDVDANLDAAAFAGVNCYPTFIFNQVEIDISEGAELYEVKRTCSYFIRSSNKRKREGLSFKCKQWKSLIIQLTF